MNVVGVGVLLFSIAGAGAATSMRAAEGYEQASARAHEQAPSAGGRIRWVDREPGTRLMDLLRANDGILEVVDQRPDGMPPPPAPPGHPDQGKSRLQLVCERAALIALVRVRSQQGALTVSGDWVDTTIRGEVVEIVKNAQPEPVAIGEEVVLTGIGGEVSVGRQTLRAYHNGDQLWQNGRTYLVLAFTRQGDVFSTFRGSWLLDDGESFVPTSSGHLWVAAPTMRKEPLLREIAGYARAPR